VGLTPIASLRYFWRFFVGTVAVKNLSQNLNLVDPRGLKPAARRGVD
jgi:hypothetical protein